MKKNCLIMLVVLGCCVPGVRAQEGSVSRPVRFRLPVETYVRNYVEPRLATWMKWDRYEESSAQYKERVADENKKRKIGEWEREALAALMDGAGIEITPREESLYGNLVVFSATSESEIAYPFEEKQHRMFTYFLLKKLQETEGNVTYFDLAGYVIDNVKSHAFDINRKTQTPKVQTSHDITDRWKTWKLIKR